jgi:ribose transport system permease protein
VGAPVPNSFAHPAHTLVVIGGRKQNTVAPIKAQTSVTAARPMAGESEAFGAAVVVIVLLEGLILGAVNGALIVLSRVPDIIVTLAMLFVWQGVALLVLPSPGGGAAQWLRDLLVGSVSTDALLQWVPKALVLIVVSLCVVWVPLHRSRLGLSIYAIGSSSLAAFRSGVSVSWTKIASYAIAGLFAAAGGLALTLSTGIGAPIPGPYLLASVAAVVLGGVALAGGKGGLLGPIVAVFILRLLRSDLTLLAVDPNVATIIEGTIMVVVVMLGAFIAMRAGRA